jgi:hypothetical protein
VIRRALRGVLLALGLGLAGSPMAFAVPDDAGQPAPAVPGPIEFAAPMSDDANPAAVAACRQFADVLDATAVYYGDFADALETYAQPDYRDPAVSTSNVTGRTALRQGAGVTMSAANTPGLAPDIANPMRSWSWGATKLLVKMGLRGGGDSLNTTANEMNDDALGVQQACAAAGTHA